MVLGLQSNQRSVILLENIKLYNVNWVLPVELVAVGEENRSALLTSALQLSLIWLILPGESPRT